MVSTSIERSFLPSRITEPLPNWRSIWESAADSALVLSMEDPSTIRSAVADIGCCSLWRGFACGANGAAKLARKSRVGDWWSIVLHLFQVRNMFFLGGGYWPLSIKHSVEWSLLNFAVVRFENATA